MASWIRPIIYAMFLLFILLVATAVAFRVLVYPSPGPGIKYVVSAWRPAGWPLQEESHLTKTSVQRMIQAWDYRCESVDRASYGTTHSGGHVIYKISCSAEDTDPEKAIRTYYFLWPNWDVTPRPYLICPDRSQSVDYESADDETPQFFGLYICEQLEDYFSAI